MTTIHRVLETALYCGDLDRAVAFYRDVLGLAVLAPGPRLIAMDVGEGTVLLLFKSGASRDGVQLPDRWLPPHDGSGPVHVAFAVAAEELADLERQRAQGDL